MTLASAQFVPLISQDSTTQVTSFIRTPVWFLPRVGHLQFFLDTATENARGTR